MSMMQTILPPNRTDAEEALDLAVAARIEGVPVPVATLWDPETCAASLLRHLAWALSVDEWDDTWPDTTKRAVIAASIPVHRIKGTIASIRNALDAAGFAGAIIMEGRFGDAHDGSLHFDGSQLYGGPDHWSGLQTHAGDFDHDASETYGTEDSWAEYRVRLPRPVTIAQSQILRRILASTAPARCHLKRLYFTEVAHLFDQTIAHDGAYTYGAA